MFIPWAFLIWEREKKPVTSGTKETQRDLLLASSFLRCLQQLELSQAEAKILELSPGLPQKRQSSKHLNVHLLPPRVCISTEVESETEYLESRILIWSESKEQINCFASLLPAELLWLNNNRCVCNMAAILNFYSFSHVD